MKQIQMTMLVVLAFSTIACVSNTKKEAKREDTAILNAPSQNYKTAYFASGCFWCVEAIFESVNGVKEVVSGYAGGVETNPTYEEVSYGRTTHAEAVRVLYDSEIISFKTLVEIFFGSHDPTTLNSQGPDKGAHYRSIAFYMDQAEMKIINDHMAKLVKERVYSSPIVTEVRPYINFYKAEDYHQDFETKHPNNPYIINVSKPRLKQFQEKFPELLKKEKH